MKKLLIIVASLLTQVSCSDSVSSQLQHKLNQIHSMSASFSQSVKTKRRAGHSSGTMALVRPGHFRWQTQSPTAQLIIADGKRLWVYDKDLEQVSVRRQAKGIGGTAGLFLSGYGNTVTRDFNVTMTNKGGQEVYDLHPKQKRGGSQYVRLTFAGASLVGIQIQDQLGQTTNVHLSHVRTNVQLSPALFQLKVPKGVDIVQQ